MRRASPAVLALALAFAAAPCAFADSPSPPEGAKPLSQIIGQVEQSPDFRYVDEVELKQGLYKVEYYTKDGVAPKNLYRSRDRKPR